MTVTETAARQIADTFYQLDRDDRDALTSDDGLTLTVDGDDVAVWYRASDHKIAAFTNPTWPDNLTEQWAELDGPERRYHVSTTGAVQMERTSDNVSPWSVDPMTRDELVEDIINNLDGVDLDWNGDEVTATITNPVTDERERIIFVMEQA